MDGAACDLKHVCVDLRLNDTLAMMNMPHVLVCAVAGCGPLHSVRLDCYFAVRKELAVGHERRSEAETTSTEFVKTDAGI